ncbi:TetR family transcriptional regulator [Frankia sp. CcI49]|uniref:TetR/AcrR family transcriptional regulator n=1 Tax=unclassified Frankia TaxID=2632575 RepID=UPI0006CA4120|nr:MULTISPECIES: TetR family transcriptional regulator [unclassified Frankia]KPM53785.1 TetR family transcriptional regulator [Frankia sp. R43]ONH59610.1 TetR family transcriptional regulator [Frankia sp. CcI49]
MAEAEGLRERKKRRTRQTIIEVAHELFQEKGFDSATLEEIAAGADVSVRTLFRYFTGKEAIALAPLDEMGDLTVAALRRRPADEPPLTALRCAALSAWALMSPDGGSLRRYADQLLPSDEATPLAGAVLSRLIVIGDRLAMELVDNEVLLVGGGTGGGAGLDGSVAGTVPTQTSLSTVTELDAQMIVVSFLGAIQVAIRSWCRSGSTDLVELLAVVEKCLDRICLRT